MIISFYKTTKSLKIANTPKILLSHKSKIVLRRLDLSKENLAKNILNDLKGYTSSIKME